MSIYYIDGEYVEASQATLPAHDLAILRGYGIFDFLRTYGGKPFQLGAHLRRLEQSANLLGLHCPYDIEELMTIVMETLSRNTYPESTIRIVLTGGDSPDNFTPQGNSRLMVMIAPIFNIPSHHYTDGAEVVTIDIERYLPTAKSLNYIPGIIARRKASEINPKSIEAIYCVNGNVIEGTTTNTFIVKDGKWITAGENLLHGITRAEVIKLIDSYTTLEVRDITLDEYLQADEVIITSSNREVMPIVKVNDVVIDNGTPGDHTQILMSHWREMTEAYAQPTTSSL